MSFEFIFLINFIFLCNFSIWIFAVHDEAVEFLCAVNKELNMVHDNKEETA